MSIPKVYEGLRHPDEADGAGEAMVWVNGQPLPLAPSLKLFNHSPTGFSWGYGGSGPAQLALAILLDYFEGDGERAVHYHQPFKWAKVARWPQSMGWRITSEEIKIFLDGEPPWEPEPVPPWERSDE